MRRAYITALSVQANPIDCVRCQPINALKWAEFLKWFYCVDRLSLILSLSGLTPTHMALTDQMCCFGLPVIWKPRNKQINLSHCPLWHNRWVEPCGVRAVCLLMFGSEPSFTGFDMCVCVCVYFCLYIWKHLCGSGLQLSMHCPFLRSCQHADIVS